MWYFWEIQISVYLFFQCFQIYKNLKKNKTVLDLDYLQNQINSIYIITLKNNN